ncbi:MAG: YdcF family protein [Legionellales bacterium]
MSTLFIFILLLTATCLLALKQTKAGLTTLLLAITCFMLIGTGLIPAIILGPLQRPFIELPEPLWKKKNAIVLLGAGSIKLPITHQFSPTILAYSRIHEAAHLYFACTNSHHDCSIIISGGDPRHIGESEAQTYRNALLQLNINATDLVLESHSKNTYKNAVFTSNYLKKNQFDQVVLVTSGFHLQRSLLYFSKFGIAAQPALADYLTPQYSFIPLGYNFAMTDLAVHEYLGIVQLYVYNFLGWNRT